MTDFKFIPVQKNSLVIELTSRLMEFVFSGSIQPGEKLPAERQLSEALGVGRSSIREAIKALTVLGVLEVRQGDGTYLKKSKDSGLLSQSIEWGLLLGERHTMDLIEARKEIEIVIAGFAAEKADDQEINELRAIMERMNESNITEIDDFVGADILFHLQLAKMAKNTVLKDILVSIRTLLRTWIKSVIESAGDTRFSYDYHLDIYDAIYKRDVHAAKDAMRKHMDDATDRLIEVLNNAENAEDEEFAVSNHVKDLPKVNEND
jgi:GntR family transcriptional repressor for pyruvate dehydrogenase complex